MYHLPEEKKKKTRAREISPIILFYITITICINRNVRPCRTRHHAAIALYKNRIRLELEGVLRTSHSTLCPPAGGARPFAGWPRVA